MTLYEKVGRRYKSVRDERTWDSWPHGFHLVYTPDDGGRSIRFRINPETAGLRAAAKLKEDALRKLISDTMEMRPARKPLTEAQRDAWERFSEAMGGDRFLIEYESVMGLIERIVGELLKE
jgi:hypothetical protein